jgi:hypothetical protein
MKSFLHRRYRLSRVAVAAITAGALAALSACASANPSSSAGSGPTTFKAQPQDNSAPITVWADSTRLPAVQAYQKAHPGVKMNIVTYDGSADGSTYLQTKVQLFDRTGKGWPDVVFASPTDVTWASQPTSSSAQPFAAPVDEGLVPQATLDNFAKGSLTPCQLNGHTYCLRNDIAQVVVWYNKTLLDKFGYSVPTTWQQYEALGQKVAKEHPGYLVGAVGDTNSQESYFWSAQCPAQQLTGPNTLRVDLKDPHCTKMAALLDTLIKAKLVTTQGFFVVWAVPVRRRVQDPGRADHGSAPAQVGGRVPDLHRKRRRWRVDDLLAQQEPQGVDRSRRVADDVEPEPRQCPDLPRLHARREGLAGQPREQGLLRDRREQGLPGRGERGLDRVG